MVYFLEHLRPHIYIHQFQDFSHTLELSAQCACNLLGGSGLRAWLCGAVALWAKILAPRGPFESAQVSKAEKTAALIAMHRGNTLFQTLPWNIPFCNLYDLPMCGGVCQTDFFMFVVVVRQNIPKKEK